MAILQSADWKLSLLGGMRLQIKDGQVLALPSGRGTALLACLAVAPHFTMNRGRLAEMLWPEQPPETSRNRLKQTLYMLRQEIERAGFAPDTLLLGGRADLRLNPESVEVDTATFVQMLNLAGKEPEPALRELELAKALRLYQGELLPDFYEEWVIEERRSLDNQYQETLTELTELRATLGNLEGALTTARRLAEVNPYREEAHLSIMRLCAALGQPAAAVRQYRLLEQTLQDELQMAPSAQATTLLAQLQKQAEPQPAAPLKKETAVPLPVSPQDAVPQETFVPPVLGNLVTSLPQTVPDQKPRFGKRLAFAALALLLLLAGGIFYRHRFSAVPFSDGKSLSAPPKETVLWAAHDTPQQDEADFEPVAIAADVKGNTFVTGYVQTKKNDVDILTLKFDPDGKLIWHERYNGPGNDCDRPSALVVDAEGNVSVAGESYTPPGKQEQEGWHPVLLRYAPDKKRVWEKRLPEILERHEKSVLLVSDGDKSLWLAANVLRSGHTDIMLLHFSPTGEGQSVPLRLPDSVYKMTDLTADKYGVWIVGSAFQPIKRGYGGDTDWLIARYINMPGFPLDWYRFVEGQGNRNDSANRAVADTHGNLFVTGITDEGDAANGGTGLNVTTAKYDNQGNRTWIDRQRVSVPVIKGITVDSEGNVAVTGRKEDMTDVLTLHYTSDGQNCWEKSYDGTGARTDEGNDITALPDGRVAVVGTTYSGAGVRGGTGFDALILLYGPKGNFLWRHIHEEKGHGEHGCVLTPDPSGNLLVAVQAGQHRLALLKIKP